MMVAGSLDGPPQGRYDAGGGESAFAWRAAATIGLASYAAGIAAWLSPASVQIAAWPRTGASRIALFAPLYAFWWALAAAAVAALALWFVPPRTPAARVRRAHIVAPLGGLWLWTVPFLPWLPDKLPLLIVLAGPVRWLIAIAAMAAVAARAWRSPAWSLSWQLPGRRTVFALSLVLYLVLGFRSLGRVGLGGDEPHYLVITHSLLADGDLKIENNHARRDYAAFFGGVLRPDYMTRGLDGEIYSIHAPGLSVLVLPGYALAGARGAVATLCLLAALAALAIFDVAALVGGRGVAWLTWAAVCLTVPFIPHAWAIYPELAGTAIVAWAVAWLISPGPASPARWAARGLCLAALPWLHTKFVVLLAGLVLALLWRLRSRFREAVALLAPLAVSGALWLAYFYVIYGSFDPQAPYGAYPDEFIRTENIPRSLVGLLFDQKFGLLVYAPVYLLAAAGAYLLARDRRWRGLAVAVVAIAGVYALTSARLYMWWGGSSAPARFVVPLTPLAAPLVAIALVHVRGTAAAAIAWPALVVSLLVAAAGSAGIDRLLLFSDPHGSARIVQLLQGSAPLAAALPTFTEPDWPAPIGRLLPWAAAAVVALTLARFAVPRWRLSLFWTTFAEVVVFLVVGALLAGPFSATTRAEAVARGRLALIEAFDPRLLRAFDYSRTAKVVPHEWLGAATVAFDHDPMRPADPIGRITGPLSLPPGLYEVKVWFQGQRPRDGHLQIALGRGHVLARADGPLPNPATLTFDMPLQIPTFWVQLTERSAAQAVTRVELTPMSVVPRSERRSLDVRAVESIVARSNAYIVYVDRYTFPENGVFWTRGTGRGEILVVPAGASQIALTLHVGPNAGPVRITVGDAVHEVPMAPNETRLLVVDAPAGASWVPITVEASAAFRPADVDPQSSDTRELGCQVRVELR